MRSLAEGTIESIPLFRLNRDGKILGTVASLGTSNAGLLLEDKINPEAMRGYMTRQPFSDRDIMAVSGDGNLIYLLQRPIAKDDTGAHFSLTALTPASDTLFSRRYRYKPRRVERSVADSIFNYYVNRDIVRTALGNPPQLRLRKWVEEALFVPDYYPPITRIVPGNDATIWLERELPGPGDASHWLVLNGEGDIEATIEIPPGVQLMAADRQNVWGVYRDELDVPYLIRYRVRH